MINHITIKFGKDVYRCEECYDVTSKESYVEVYAKGSSILTTIIYNLKIPDRNNPELLKEFGERIEDYLI